MQSFIRNNSIRNTSSDIRDWADGIVAGGTRYVGTLCVRLYRQHVPIARRYQSVGRPQSCRRQSGSVAGLTGTKRCLAALLDRAELAFEHLCSSHLKLSLRWCLMRHDPSLASSA